MNDFESRRPASKYGEIDAAPPTDGNPTWRQIRNWSVLEFAKRTAKALGALDDKKLFRDLCDMALSDGAKVFDFNGFHYTGDMVLDVWRRGGEPDLHAPIQSRKAWDEFQAALATVRDPNVPMVARPALLRLGEAIEARQRPHAVARGWA